VSACPVWLLTSTLCLLCVSVSLWPFLGGDILAETDASGSTTAEYIFFGGKRIAMLPAGGIRFIMWKTCWHVPRDKHEAGAVVTYCG